MKNKFSNIFISFSVLFVMLFQSSDGIKHYHENLKREKCLHKHYSDDYFTHEHSSLENCFVCSFHFSSFVSTNTFSFNTSLLIDNFSTNSFLENQLYNHNSLFSFYLRGPPVFII